MSYCAVIPVKTYATESNAIKAVQKKINEESLQKVTWIVVPTKEGRFFPLFMGERAIQEMIHFHFNVAM